MTFQISTFLVVLGLTALHIVSKYFTFKFISLRKFMSIAAGVGITYIILHLLPIVSHGEDIVLEELPFGNRLLIYFIALFGFSCFYILDRFVIIEWQDKEVDNPGTIEKHLFWAHILFYIIYNLVIGYSLTRESTNFLHLIIVFFAFALHFITNDWNLRYHHEKAYDHYGRTLLSLSILIGYGLGSFTNLPEYVLSMSEAFVFGGMLLHVVKKELPSEEEGSIRGYLIGIFSAAILFAFV